MLRDYKSLISRAFIHSYSADFIVVYIMAL